MKFKAESKVIDSVTTRLFLIKLIISTDYSAKICAKRLEVMDIKARSILRNINTFLAANGVHSEPYSSNYLNLNGIK